MTAMRTNSVRDARRGAGQPGAPDMFAPVLGRLATDAAAHFGVERLQFQPVQYDDRPFTHLLRVHAYGDREREPLATVFVKIVKPRPIEGGEDALRRRLIRDYEATRRVQLALLPYEELGVVPPLACYPEHMAIVTEGVSGPTLLEHLQAEAAWFPSSARLKALQHRLSLVGRWLQAFQGSGPRGEAVTIEALRAYVDIRLERLMRHGVRRFDAAGRQRLLRHIDWLGAQVVPEELAGVCIHADLALGNILVSGRRIVVLDFEMANYGTSLHDLTRVFLQLELLAVKPQVRPSLIATLQTALLQGFDPAATPERPLFRLLMLLHRINNVGTLTLNQRSFPETLYNRIVVRQHLRAIAAELARRADSDETAVAGRPS